MRLPSRSSRQARAPQSARIERAAPAPVRSPEPQVVTETNIKRDAAIGACAGAAVGAIVNDDNRVKGAIVGGVIGGAAGAITGATIDKKKKVVVPR